MILEQVRRRAIERKCLSSVRDIIMPTTHREELELTVLTSASGCPCSDAKRVGKIGSKVVMTPDTP